MAVPIKLAATTCRIDCVSPSCCPPALSTPTTCYGLERASHINPHLLFPVALFPTGSLGDALMWVNKNRQRLAGTRKLEADSRRLLTLRLGERLSGVQLPLNLLAEAKGAGVSLVNPN